MTKEEIGTIYKERVITEAKAYAENSLSDTKSFVDKDTYEGAFNDLVNTFIAGADCSKRILEEIITKYKKESCSISNK